MPRKSAADLVTVPRIAVPEARLRPPADLTDGQLAIWRGVVDALPARWFTRDQAALLAQFCRHAARCSELEALLSEVDPRADFERYGGLVKLIAIESGRVGFWARSLRLTAQARIEPKTAALLARSDSAAPGVEALLGG